MNNAEVEWYKEKGKNEISLLEALNKALDEVYNSKPNFKNELNWKNKKQDYIKQHIGK